MRLLQVLATANMHMHVARPKSLSCTQIIHKSNWSPYEACMCLNMYGPEASPCQPRPEKINFHIFILAAEQIWVRYSDLPYPWVMSDWLILIRDWLGPRGLCTGSHLLYCLSLFNHPHIAWGSMYPHINKRDHSSSVFVRRVIPLAYIPFKVQ